MKDAKDLAETADAADATVDADAVMVSATTAACGSFFFSAAAAVSAMDAATAVVSVMTAACGSFFFSAAVAVSAMVADAAMAVDADARQHNISCIGLKETESFFRLFSHIYL